MTAPEPKEHLAARTAGDAVDALVAELGWLPESSEEILTGVFGRFERWCITNGCSPFPAEEQTVLRYLHSQYPLVGHAYAKTMVSRIRQAHALQGEQLPTWPRARLYLSHLRTDPNTPKPQPKIDAIRVEHAAEMAQALASPPSNAATRRIAGRIAVALAGATSLKQALDVDPRSITTVRTGVILRGEDGATRFIDAMVDPDLVTALGEFASDPDSSGYLPANTSGLRGAFRRAGLDWPGISTPLVLPPDEQRWLLANCDARLHDQLRNRAYLLTGLVSALRHESLRHVDLEDLEERGRGYELVATHIKNDSAWWGASMAVPCLAAESAVCDSPACPGCALRAWLSCIERSQRRTTGPVFATCYGGEWRRMTRQNARLVLRAMWPASGGDPAARIATRGLRAGAASSAADEGAELAEIARLTLHNTLSECAKYLRPRDGWRWDYALDADA